MGTPFDLFQGVNKGFWAGGAGAPVDTLTLALNALIAGGGYVGHKAGLLNTPPELIEKPVGGSEWIADKMRSRGLLQDNPGSTADNIGNVLGGLLGPVTAAKAPQIARWLLQTEANAMAPATLNKQAGAVLTPKPFVYPQDKALATAQRNAALPIEQGGLGLRADNTPMERAKALGFTDDAFHGTPNDGIVRSRQFKNEKLGKSTRVSDAEKGHFTADRGEAASEYIWSDGGTDGGNVLPLLLGGNRAKATLPGEWAPGKYDAALDAARAGGFDGLDIAGTTTLGKPGNYQVSFDPKNIRSRFAAFDPMRRNEADILGRADPDLLKAIAASLLGYGAFGGTEEPK